MTATPPCPPTNITMPVFGRFDETLTAILAVRKNTRSKIFLTVVDNGNGGDFTKELTRLADEKVIDNLFILDRNYGISCACNIGWSLVDAPFFMKIDNDYKILSDTWLECIYGIWGRDRHATLMGPAWDCRVAEGREETPYGVRWTMPISFVGSAFLVSRKIRDQMGFFSEDYGLYGEEDADYCLRCHHAGIRKMSFAAEPLMEIISNDAGEPEYAAFKRAAHTSNVGQDSGQGIFALNLFLYKHGLRALRVPLKYRIAAVKGMHVTVEENPEYGPFREKLDRCLDVYNASGRNPSPGDLESMRAILA